MPRKPPVVSDKEWQKILAGIRGPEKSPLVLDERRELTPPPVKFKIVQRRGLTNAVQAEKA